MRLQFSVLFNIYFFRLCYVYKIRMYTFCKVVLLFSIICGKQIRHLRKINENNNYIYSHFVKISFEVFSLHLNIISIIKLALVF